MIYISAIRLFYCGESCDCNFLYPISGFYILQGEFLVKEWGTGILYEWDYVRHIIMVKLPNDVISHTKKDLEPDDAELVEIHLQKYGVEASLKETAPQL